MHEFLVKFRFGEGFMKLLFKAIAYVRSIY